MGSQRSHAIIIVLRVDAPIEQIKDPELCC